LRASQFPSAAQHPPRSRPNHSAYIAYRSTSRRPTSTAVTVRRTPDQSRPGVRTSSTRGGT
jgi:hypothetical protein